MAGIYVHIPFCKTICGYCDFFRSANLAHREPYIQALHRELDAACQYLPEREIRTVYFGGGTPSTIAPERYTELIEHMGRVYDLSHVEEITLEANPDDLSDDYLTRLADTPINRLSVGIQSLHDDELKFMNRRHTAKQARKAIETAQNRGFDNISIDLIYGLPCSSTERWSKNLQHAVSMGVQHISAYHLGIEPHTRFGTLHDKGELMPVDEEVSHEQFRILREILLQNGFEHYEISNFALPDRRSRHNSSYWNDTPYLGLGAGAHSFDGASRRWAVGNLPRYLRESGTDAIYTTERLTADERYNEYIMTRLRTCEGVNTEELRRKFGAQKLLNFERRCRPFLEQKQLQNTAGHTFITADNLLISDSIICELFVG
ncbi:MAG: radical SAM family heme chaperone HemW [Rikenellaceae bacterium]|nr:radical SAM family heme chaperone HemW [Rikenellaceae bacterium]